MDFLMDVPQKLSAKLVAAMKAIDAVAKTGYNANQKYKYVTAADVAHEVRSALIELGISFVYNVVGVNHWERPTSSGGSMMYCEVCAHVTLTDTESGEAITIQCFGWGSDSGDKGIYKALTGALKYALRMQFIIPDDADPENESEEQPQHGKSTTRAQRPAFIPVNQQQRSPEEYLSTLVPEPGDDGPPVDAYFNPDAEDPDPKPKPQVGPPIGSKAKVLYAIAMGKGWNSTQYRNWVNRMGYSTDRDIPLARFEQLKQKLESQ